MKIVIEVNVDKDDLYSYCYEAWEHAEQGMFDTGSNYWMTMFVDRLNEKLEEQVCKTLSQK